MAAPIAAALTSESEDEAEDNKLREAAVEGIDLYKSSKQAPVSSVCSHGSKKQTQLPSRRTRDINEEEENDNGITHGFKKHIAKKLSQALDSQVDATQQRCKLCQEPSPADTGIKLFSASSSYISDNPEEATFKPQRRKRQVSSSDGSSEDERLKEAAVSHDFIISHTKDSFTQEEKAGGKDSEINTVACVKVDSDMKESRKKKKKKRKKENSVENKVP